MEKGVMRWHVACLFGILILAAFLRFFLLHDIPPGLYPDEAVNGIDALEALQTGDFRSFYKNNNGREGLFINLQAIAVQIFGPSAWTLRAVSALAGTLTILFFYFLAKEAGIFIFSREAASREKRAEPSGYGLAEGERGAEDQAAPVSLWRTTASFRGEPHLHGQVFALLASFLLAVSFWHINFSRIGFRAILLPLFSSAALFFLLRGIRRNSTGDFLASGFTFGLSLSTYIASRVIPLLAVPSFFRNARSANVGRVFFLRWGVFTAALFIAVAPLAGYFIVHPSDFLGRAGDVSIFAAEDPLSAFLASAGKTLLMFNVHGDENWRHNIAGRPELDPLTGLLFLAGLVAAFDALRRPDDRRWITAIILAWFILALLPAVTTREGVPHALRTLGALPPVMLLAALGAAWFWDRLSESRVRAARNFIATAIISAILLLNTHAYFLVWAGNESVVGEFRSDLVAAAETLNREQSARRFVIVNEGDVALDGVFTPAATIRFLTEEDPAIRYLLPQRLGEIVAEPGRTLIVTTKRPDETLDTSLRALFPDIERIEENGIVFFRL